MVQIGSTILIMTRGTGGHAGKRGTAAASHYQRLTGEKSRNVAAVQNEWTWRAAGFYFLRDT